MIGDRYSFNEIDEFILEVIYEEAGAYSHELIKNSANTHSYPVGMRGQWGDLSNNSRWTYLGNFSKTKEFTKLYQKLL